MKKNKYFSLVALAVAALATSCSTEDTPSATPQDRNGATAMTLTATIGAPKTRVGMIRDGSSASLYWHENDAICVLTRDEAQGTTKSEEFTTTAETGAETADFSGMIDNGSQAVCAVYPYSKGHALSTDGTTLTFNLPSTYTYTKVESSIFSTLVSDRVNHVNMPMFGTVSDGKVAFKHMGGMMVIRVDKMPITAGTLTVIADQPMQPILSKEPLISLSAMLARSLFPLFYSHFLKNILNFNTERHYISFLICIFANKLRI